MNLLSSQESNHAALPSIPVPNGQSPAETVYGNSVGRSMEHKRGMLFFSLIKKKPEPAFRFVGGEIVMVKQDAIVRLEQEGSDTCLRAGDWGIVWAIYGQSWYEGTFFGWDGRNDDLEFEEHEVEEVIDARPESYPDDLEKFQRRLAGDDCVSDRSDKTIMRSFFARFTGFQ